MFNLLVLGLDHVGDAKVDVWAVDLEAEDLERGSDFVRIKARAYEVVDDVVGWEAVWEGYGCFGNVDLEGGNFFKVFVYFDHLVDVVGRVVGEGC